MLSLAFMRDSSKAIAIGLATPLYAKAQVQIYSPAGESILMCSVDVLHSHTERNKLTPFHCSGVKAK
jgi:hypothetical protein